MKSPSGMQYKFIHIPRTGGVAINRALRKKIKGHKVWHQKEHIYSCAFVSKRFLLLKAGGPERRE
jgi:hypothetical protein